MLYSGSSVLKVVVVLGDLEVHASRVLPWHLPQSSSWNSLEPLTGLQNQVSFQQRDCPYWPL